MKLKSFLALFFFVSPIFCAHMGIDEYRMGKFKEAAKLLLLDEMPNHEVNYYLGELNLYGYGVPRDEKNAIDYYQKSAQQDDLNAIQMMARYALLIEKNPSKALDWFKKAAFQKDVDALMYCAASYQYGYGASKNLDEARRYYIDAAKLGQPRAQYFLAQYFFNPKKGNDKHLGEIWLEKSAKNGDGLALVVQAQQLHQQKEYAKAKDILAKALKKEVPQAFKLQSDWFFEQDDVIHGHALLLKAAKKAYPSAQLALGQFYLRPDTPFFNFNYGFLWILHAARYQNHEAKQFIEHMQLNAMQAQKWQEFLAQEKNPSYQENVTAQRVAMALSHHQFTHFDFAPYRLKGIWSDWQNKDALAQKHVNAYPKFFQLNTHELFKPSFQWVESKDIPIHEYLDAFNQMKGPLKPYQGLFPNYLDELPRNYTHQDLKAIKRQAYLGVVSAQFQLATCYEFGWGLKKNISKAKHWYLQAIAQDDVKSEYQLALLELTGDERDVEIGKSYLRDAAFKGDVKAQWTLALLNETQDENQLHEAKNMLMLAAVNGNGIAMYRLAEWMSREPVGHLSSLDRQNRDIVLTKLYRSAFERGVHEAALPLAFYQALSDNKHNRQWAMKTALSFASQGNQEAAILLGLLIERDQSHTHDNVAKQWFSQAKNHPIGAFVWSSFVNDRFEKQALLEKATQVNFPYAYLNLGILKAQNQQSSFDDLQKAADLNNLKAKHLLANLLVLDGKKDATAKARQVFQDLAEKGDVQSQWKLGYLMALGIGGPQATQQGLEWLQKSAQQLPLAQFVLGYLYHMGQLSTTPNEQQAKFWFEKASSAIPKASIALGYLYEVVDKNYPMALKYYNQVRQQERILANYNIALMYEYGKGTQPNFFRAKRYFLSAAEGGSSAAMFKLANIYKQAGFTMTSVDYLKKAAEKGHRPAIAALQLRDYL